MQPTTKLFINKNILNIDLTNGGGRGGSVRLRHREGHKGRESAMRPDSEWMRNQE